MLQFGVFLELHMFLKHIDWLCISNAYLLIIPLVFRDVNHMLAVTFRNGRKAKLHLSA